MRKTKIICTLGPATDEEVILRKLIENGMNVARFNFSHSDYEEHRKRFLQLEKLRKEYQKPIAALLDTKGPEIRIGFFKEKSVSLVKGQEFTLTTEDIEGDNTKVSVNYKDLPGDVAVDSVILLDDGKLSMKVLQKDENSIICRVLNDGVISNRKGVNVPGADLSMPFISDKDREDIIFAAKTGFDFIAASFTRTAEDILSVRKLLEDYGCHSINIIAKIENIQGVENIDEIINAADGIMIARGDLGVELPGEEVPVIQKMIIQKVYAAGKQVITATQMLDSMMNNPRPTRAETTDVANAIYDGTSAIMLSGETAAGKYPVEALDMMVKIAERTERDINYKKRFQMFYSKEHTEVTEAISHATCTTAHDLNAKAIITVTKSGNTAKMVSKYRPDCPIMGCTTEMHVYRQLNLSWGVTPVLMKEATDTFQLFDDAASEVLKLGYIDSNSLVVITAGVPLGQTGTTNLIKVHQMGEM